MDIKVENREDLINHLHLSGIGTRRMYPPINKQPAYNVFGSTKVSNQIGQMVSGFLRQIQLSDESIDIYVILLKVFMNKFVKKSFYIKIFPLLIFFFISSCVTYDARIKNIEHAQHPSVKVFLEFEKEVKNTKTFDQGLMSFFSPKARRDRN